MIFFTVRGNNDENQLVDEIKQIVDNGLAATTFVTDLPTRPNVNFLPPRLIRPFRSTKTLKQDAEAFARKQSQKPITKTVPFKGKVKYILREIEDGLQSSFSYVGARDLDEFKENCEFNFISGSGTRESKF